MFDRRQSRVLGGTDASKGEKISKAVVDGARVRNLAWLRALVLALGLDLCPKQTGEVPFFRKKNKHCIKKYIYL